MSARLKRIGANPTLKAYIQGAAKQQIAPIQEFLAPTVPTGAMEGKFKKWDEKTTLVIPSTKRGMKGKATEVGFDLSDESFNLTPHALDYPVDKLEMEDESLINLLQEGADITSQLAALSSYKATIDQALSSLGAGTDVDPDTANIDLVATVDTAIRSAILGARGFSSMMEMRILWGFDAWRVFKNHPSVLSRFTGGAKKDIKEVTLEMVSSLFVLPVKMMISTAVADANKALDAADVEFLLGESLIVFATSANPTRFDTSFMKTLRLRGQYMSMRGYERDDGRVEVAGFDWNEEIITANAAAGARINWT